MSDNTVVATEYYYNGSVLIGMKIGTGSSAKVLRFSYDASGNVVAVDYSTNNGSSFTTYYYLRNAQNDVIKLIDGSGNTVVEYTYDSWGKIISSTGTLANTVGTYQPFRYRGYVYDTETQWYYLQSRYYDPATCRFISADVLLSTGQGVIGHNSFAYCLNKPINTKDDDGSKARDLSQNSLKGASGYNYWSGWYESIDAAVIIWGINNAKLTKKDHRERCGIIISKKIDGKQRYKVITGFIGVNKTCWYGFICGYIANMLKLGKKVEGFIHTHTAYPPNKARDGWNYTDYGPSDADISLFSFPGIKRQFIANEKGGIYEFYTYSVLKEYVRVLKKSIDGPIVVWRE